MLDGDLAAAEPNKLRYRLLYVAARISRTPAEPASPSRELALNRCSDQRLQPLVTPTTRRLTP